jgi:aspartate kinase
MDLFDDENHAVFAAIKSHFRPRIFFYHITNLLINFVYDQVVSLVN